MGLTAINRALLRDAMPADHHSQETFGGPLVAMLRQEDIDGLARLSHAPIQVAPLPFHPNVCLIHAPTDPYRLLAAMQRGFQRGTVLHDPALDSRVVNGHPTSTPVDAGAAWNVQTRLWLEGVST